MRLKTIKLVGFKSFVDPTVLHLSGNLSAVVGPNGCGKSNVIDAVRWVMGESSAKNLRGGALVDVIFSGSTSRKPIGQASVELLFDNAEGRLGGQYASYSEIAIKRLVTRDGQSKYFLNGQSCRRRDIKDIFLGTGLGPRSYAIIEQGMISRVIDAKPDDLRIFLEEAAGISKYKERRRETENRIKHTNDNLDRLNDIRNELEKQMRHLERQSEAAQRYNTYKADIDTKNLQLAAMSYERLDAEIKTIEQQILTQSVTMESHLATVQSVKTSQEKVQVSQQQAHQHLNDVQKDYYGLGAEISKIEQSLQHHTERKAQWAEDKNEALQALEIAKQQHTADQTRAQEIASLLDTLRPEAQIALEHVLATTTAESDAETALETWRESHDAMQKEALEPAQQASSEKSNVAQLERQIQRTQERHEKLMSQKAALTIPDESDIEALAEQIDVTETDIETAQEQLNTARANSEELRSAIQSLRPEIAHIQEQLHTTQGEVAAEKAIQANALGKNSSVRQAWLEAQELDTANYIAEKLQVASGWEGAVETVLGDALNALGISADKLTTASQQMGTLAGEGIHLMAWESNPAQKSHDPSRLTTHLIGAECLPSALYSALHKVHVANTVDEALALLPSLSADESVVTPEGFWFNQAWSKIKASGEDSQESVLKREETIKQLKETLELHNEVLTEKQDRLADLESQLSDMNAEKERCQQLHHELKQTLTQCISEKNIKSNQFMQQTAQQDQIKQDLKECEQALQQTQTEVQESRKNLAELLDHMSRCHEAMTELQAQKTGLQEGLQSARSKAREARDSQHAIAMNVQTQQTQLDALVSNQSRMADQMTHYTHKIEQLTAHLAQADEPVEELKITLEATLEKRLQSEDRLNEARDTVAELDNELRELSAQLNTATQAVEELRTKSEQFKLDCQSLIVRRETVTERLAESAEPVENILKAIPEEANEASWQAAIETLSEKMQRLGAINLAAIEEFDAAKERKVYLEAQLEDLVEALTTLENAIKTIDKETRAKFEETFQTVNGHFKVLFPQLFGGGQAELELIGDDLLSTGVGIMARPPGKKNTSIQLLSGGEKALTAIALVFSIFQLNPAPFCLLDEVDAPLDDTNVGRFCRLVQEMAKSVQFIFISHNKVAIEMAEQLHGVTMREPGVSRLVTVDIEEAKSLAQA